MPFPLSFAMAWLEAENSNALSCYRSIHKIRQSLLQWFNWALYLYQLLESGKISAGRELKGHVLQTDKELVLWGYD